MAKMQDRLPTNARFGSSPRAGQAFDDLFSIFLLPFCFAQRMLQYLDIETTSKDPEWTT